MRNLKMKRLSRDSMSRYLYQPTLLALVLLLSSCVPGNLQQVTIQSDSPPDWPEGEAAYENMVSMTDFGYRKIDTTANENTRNWIASELEAMGRR